MGILNGKGKKEPQIVRLDLAMNIIKNVTREFKTELHKEGKQKQSEAVGSLDIAVFKVELKRFIDNVAKLSNFGILYIKIQVKNIIISSF